MILDLFSRRRMTMFAAAAGIAVAAVSMPAQQMVTDTRDPSQTQDEDFAKAVREWTTQPYYMSPLVDHLPKVAGIPSPKDVLGYHIGAPAKLTYYADILKYYRALAAATPRVKVETIGRSDEDRELVVVWVSSDENIRNLQRNRDNLAKIADPRGLSPDQITQLIATTKPHYHLMGGLHSGETGPSEMLMELVYRLATGGWRHAGRPVLGKVRLSRQQPRHQPVAGLDARARRLVLHGASADHARPPRSAGAHVHLQRRRTAEPEPRRDPVRRASMVLELRARADDEVGHAGRVHARLHGRLVPRLSRLGRVQPQRHDADVRNAVGTRG